MRKLTKEELKVITRILSWYECRNYLQKDEETIFKEVFEIFMEELHN